MTAQQDRLTTIAFNVLQCSGFPRPDNGRPFDAAAYAEALARWSPDIVTFSEAPEEAFVGEVAGHLGMRHVYFPGPEHWPGALMTRFEVVHSRNCPVRAGERPPDLFTRHWGTARLRRKNGADVVVHSVHLHPRDIEVRAREVSEVLAALEPDLRAGLSIVVQGDLNHMPDGPEYARWTGAGLVDSFAAAGGGDGFTFRSTERGRRIDYVFAGGPLAERVAESRPLAEPPFTPGDAAGEPVLSDHVPQMAVFE